MKCSLYDKTLETRVRNFMKQVLRLGWLGREKRKHFEIPKTTARLLISDVFRSSAIRSRISNFGRKFSILCNKLRLLDIMFKRVGFCLSSPAVVAETPLSNMCPRYKRWGGTGGCKRCIVGTYLYTRRNAWHSDHCHVQNQQCAYQIYDYLKTIANIQHNADTIKQTATSFTEPRDDALKR